jgi:hypothetical protein
LAVAPVRAVARTQIGRYTVGVGRYPDQRHRSAILQEDALSSTTPLLRRLLAVLLLAAPVVPLTMDAAHAAVPNLSIDDVTVQEPSADGALSGPGSLAPNSVAAVFTVTLDEAAPAPVSVHFKTVSYTPLLEYPRDIETMNAWLTIPAGDQSATLTVTVNRDSRYEPTEYFTVELDQPSGAAVADGVGLGTILNSNRDGSFYCGATGFTYSSEYSRTYDTYGQTNSTTFGSPELCNSDTKYEAGHFDNGVLHAFVNAVPDYMKYSAYALYGNTVADPRRPGLSIPKVGDGGLATGAAADASVTTTSGFTLKFDAARADASVQCVVVGADPPEPVLVGKSHVRGFTLGNFPHEYTTDYMKKPFGIGGQIELNKQILEPIVGGMKLTQQAVVISNDGGDEWVFGEAIVEFRGNPCRY